MVKFLNNLLLLLNLAYLLAFKYPVNNFIGTGGSCLNFKFNLLKQSVNLRWP